MSEKLSLKSLDSRLSEWEELTKGLSDELAALQAETSETNCRASALRADLSVCLTDLEAAQRQLCRDHEELAYLAHLVRHHEAALKELSSDLFCSKCFTWLYAGGFVILSLFVLWRF